MTPKKLYWIISLMTLGSFVWIGYHLIHAESLYSSSTLCLFKNVTGIPCPSCGVTRSVFMVIQGEWMQALMLNPLGFIALLFLVVSPGWMIADFILKKESLFQSYLKTEQLIRNNKRIYIPLIALVAINWIWNITKGL
jgi:hypothetical protein